jgi:hypothetical protein
LRPLVNVFVEGYDMRTREGRAAVLDDGTTMRVVAAIAGG